MISMSALLTFAVWLVVLILVVILVLWLVRELSPPEPIAKGVRIVVVVIAVLVLIGLLLSLTGHRPALFSR